MKNKLNISQAFSDIFNIYPKGALYVGLGLFLLTVLVVSVVLAVIILGFGSSFLTSDINQMDMDWIENTSSPFFYFMGIGTLIMGALFTPIGAGFLKIFREAKAGRTTNFSMIFDYFKAPFFGKLFLLGLLIGAISLIGDRVLTWLMPDNLFLSSIFKLLVYSLFILAVPLVAFKDQAPVPALRTSIQVTSINLPAILLLAISIGVLSFLGVLGCIIGLFATLPLLSAMEYTIYDHLIGDAPEATETSNENESEWGD